MPLIQEAPDRTEKEMPEKTPIVEFEHDDFDLSTIEDELRVDDLCRQLLHRFYTTLLDSGLSPEQASAMAYCTDYYLRDYLVDFLQQNVLRPQPGHIRYFAGTWYCTRTIDPEIAMLEQHLDSIRHFYLFLAGSSLITDEELATAESELKEREWYNNRIDRFLSLAGDGYEEWQKECTLNSNSGNNTDA